MIIAGAGGFAREVLEVLSQLELNDNICFFDDINLNQPRIYNQYEVIANVNNVNVANFCLGTGNPSAREALYHKMISSELKPYTVISPLAVIGKNNISIGESSNIMTGSILTCDIQIGIGVLINIGCTIGHDVEIGDFSEICPNVSISGNVKIGKKVFIGTGAIILPGITIEDGAVIGAGAVVTKNVPNGVKAIGNPAVW